MAMMREKPFGIVHNRIFVDSLAFRLFYFYLSLLYFYKKRGLRRKKRKEREKERGGGGGAAVELVPLCLRLV